MCALANTKARLVACECPPPDRPNAPPAAATAASEFARAIILLLCVRSVPCHSPLEAFAPLLRRSDHPAPHPVRLCLPARRPPRLLKFAANQRAASGCSSPKNRTHSHAWQMQSNCRRRRINRRHQWHTMWTGWAACVTVKLHRSENSFGQGCRCRICAPHLCI